MKITKYPQSCLLLEKNNKQIVIDPGNLFTAEYDRSVLGELAAVLITHKHGDHFDDDFLTEIIKEGVEVFSNSEVAGLLEGVKAIESGKAFEVAGFKVLPYDLPHCKVPEIYGIAHNTGYIIDATFFHPGDGIETSGLKIHDLAVPVAGPDISFYRA
ncbi:MAG TPA: MBL fold metallo-hydrolase, partial [Gammaproteobacteria bacterium]|nr:MBL fold metallo-hydrolase [Gammaproteobacteria bacterium]